MGRAGALLVDMSGRPVAVEVASRAEGLGFAVPWQEVLARFDRWLRPRSGDARVRRRAGYE